MTSDYIQDGDHISRQELETAIEGSWDASTSADPDNWDDDNPAYGQCAVTALVVQELMGGDIVWRDAVIDDPAEKDDYFDEDDHVSHYFNEIDGETIDLTRQQFPDETRYIEDQDAVDAKLEQDDGEDFDSLRDYVLSYEPTFHRYRQLKADVFEDLASKR